MLYEVITGVDQVEHAFHVILLGAKKHDGSQRDVATQNNVVLVANGFGLGQVDILIDGDVITSYSIHYTKLYEFIDEIDVSSRVRLCIPMICLIQRRFANINQ